jgi:hypothetical protein
MLLVIIDDLDFECIAVFPAKADAPLIVYPNRVLADTLSTKRFEPKAWCLEIVKRPNLVEEYEPTLRGSLERLEPRHTLPLKEALGILRPEGPNHTVSILR